MSLYSNKLFNFFFNIDSLNKTIELRTAIEEFKKPKYSNLIQNVPVQVYKKKKFLNLNLKVPSFCFYTLDFYINNFFPNINLKDLYFFFNIIVDCSEGFTLSSLKTFPCFWFFNTYKKKLFYYKS